MNSIGFENFQDKVDKDPEVEKVFQKYVNFFSLSEDDLQKSVLDVGTGKGNFVRYLRDVVGNKDAYGVEKNAYLVPPDTDGVFVADGFALPFHDNTFELVIAKHYLSIFMTNHKSVDALREMLRVVRPGGRLVADIIRSDEYQKMANEERSEVKDVSWLDKKLKGSLIFADELESLRRSGLSVTTKPNTKGDNIIEIRKPIST